MTGERARRPWTLADDPREPGVGVIDVLAEATTAGETRRLLALRWTLPAILHELRMQGRSEAEIAEAFDA